MILRVPPNLLTVGAGAAGVVGAAGLGAAGVVGVALPQPIIRRAHTNKIAMDTVNLFKFLPPYIFYEY
jgi:hypothetical protein